MSGPFVNLAVPRTFPLRLTNVQFGPGWAALFGTPETRAADRMRRDEETRWANRTHTPPTPRDPQENR